MRRSVPAAALLTLALPALLWAAPHGSEQRLNPQQQSALPTYIR